ncbi:hypothetical protein AMC87_PC00035 (plasmid) [Rhizobium phaseoli]|uniref:hypothetical protein n=1 Tax=Rhizobium phaseoli TaxID=396 RepID=UPI0007E92E4C|nr:hypothetical protein [Rhizobium phaseoli]ANL49738.1 hypothetical protein AMC87_PC00035 [Rhizobium phaseoli]
MQADPNYITFVFPDGLTPTRYHDLAKSLVDNFAIHPRAKVASISAGRSYVVLSEMDEAPAIDVPVLNDSTWTLTLPVPAGTDIEKLAAAAKRLPDGGDVKIEATSQYRTSTRET